RDLFFPSEDDGGLLLAVTQRHVVDFDFRLKRLALANLGQVAPRAREPFVGFPWLIHVRASEKGRDDTMHERLIMPTIAFNLNGKPVTAPYEPGMHFLEVLREECGVVSAKDGCAPEGTCGCCL